MERTDTIAVMRELNIVYGDKRFPLTAEILNIWHKYLNGYEAEDIRLAVENYVRRSEYPPAVAELMQEYEKIRQTKKRKSSQLDLLYRQAVEEYPGGEDTQEAREAFDSLSEGDPLKARKVLTRVKNVVLFWELHPTDKPPTFSDFLRGLS